MQVLSRGPASPFATARGWKARSFAAARAFLYLAVSLACALATTAALKVLLHHNFLDLARGSVEDQLLGKIVFAVLTVIAPVGLLLLVFREPIADAGIAPRRAGRLLASGLVAGAALMVLLVTVLAALGCISLRPPPSAPSTILCVSQALLWVMVAVSEEGGNRGYLLVKLAQALSFWPAAIFTSLAFMLGHALNPSESIMGLASAGLVGVVLAFSFYRLGSLWFALGFHAAWNFFESFVFGLANSGARSGASLLISETRGPAWLSGGAAGPEGSALMLPILVLLAMAVVGLARAQGVKASAPPRA